jgi:hypothetical protein
MNNQTIIIKELLNNIENNNNNAIIEITNHTVYFLQQHENDNLLDLIHSATQRGYSGIEWIDFWGVGGVDLNILIKSAYNIIIKQKLEKIIEPYYNNVNHRLGITIKRCYHKKKLKSLPIELRNIKNKSKECYNINVDKMYSISTSDITNSNIERINVPFYTTSSSNTENDGKIFFLPDTGDDNAVLYTTTQACTLSHSEKDERSPSFSITPHDNYTSNLSINNSHFDQVIIKK